MAAIPEGEDDDRYCNTVVGGSSKIVGRLKARETHRLYRNKQDKKKKKKIKLLEKEQW